MRNKITGIALCCLALLFFSSFTEKKKRVLKVMTYNIHHANPPAHADLIDLEAIAAVINKSGADLVALQEVDVHTIRSGKDVNQATELGRLTGMHAFFVKGIDYQGGEYGVAILSRFPFVATDSLRLPMEENSGGEPRVLAMVTVEPRKGKKLIFGSTHLDLKPQNRLLQMEAVVARLKQERVPSILGGDFNALPDSEVMEGFDRYFKRSSIPQGYTIPVINPSREIDFLMFRPEKEFRVVKHEVIDEQYASDHLPVYVELSY
jgi:endonuclease/exonuclease/phosphatase family metal-dependent hydrolase